VEEAQRLSEEFPVERLLEVGPGKGAITQELIPNHPNLVLCEKDKRLAQEWVDAGQEVWTRDFLRLKKEDTWLGVTPMGVVSNLPYSAGTLIFMELSRHPKHIPFMVLMFQAEVARKIRAEIPETPQPKAPPHKKEIGSLTLWTQNLWNVTRLLHVPPGAFSPPPQVDSEVLVFTPRATPKLEGVDPLELERLARKAFANRRKMIRSTLGGDLVERAGLDPTLRPEAMCWEDWACILKTN